MKTLFPRQTVALALVVAVVTVAGVRLARHRARPSPPPRLVIRAPRPRIAPPEQVPSTRVAPPPDAGAVPTSPPPVIEAPTTATPAPAPTLPPPDPERAELFAPFAQGRPELPAAGESGLLWQARAFPAHHVSVSGNDYWPDADHTYTGRVLFDPDHRHAFSYAADPALPIANGRAVLARWDLEAGMPVWFRRLSLSGPPALSPSGRHLAAFTFRRIAPAAPKLGLTPPADAPVIHPECEPTCVEIRILEAATGRILYDTHAGPFAFAHWTGTGRLLLLQPAAREALYPDDFRSVLEPDGAMRQALTGLARQVGGARVRAEQAARNAVGLTSIDRVVLAADLTATAVSPDGERLLTGCGDGAIQVRSLADPTRVERAFTGHRPGPVRLIRVANDGRHVLSVAGRELCLWDRETGLVLHHARIAPGLRDDLIAAIDVTPDGRQALVGLVGGRLVQWDLLRDRVAWEWTGDDVRTLDVASSPDARCCLSVDQEGVIRLRRLVLLDGRSGQGPSSR